MLLKYKVPFQKAAEVGQVGRCHHPCRALNCAVCVGVLVWFYGSLDCAKLHFLKQLPRKSVFINLNSVKDSNTFPHLL